MLFVDYSLFFSLLDGVGRLINGKDLLSMHVRGISIHNTFGVSLFFDVLAHPRFLCSYGLWGPIGRARPQDFAHRCAFAISGNDFRSVVRIPEMTPGHLLVNVERIVCRV